MTQTTCQKLTSELLLDYYDKKGRKLPWRENSDPYRVWVSEVMLQQTRVETVVPYFNAWIEKFPKLSDLAVADEESVLNMWKGLGYYSRARNLLKAIKIVAQDMDGLVPRDPIELRTLPGVGEYTANAIASIAYGEPVPAIDGNLRRVLSRLFDLSCPSPKELRSRADLLLNRDRPGDWNQALMDLGATVCTSRAPVCEECPLEEQCQSRARGTQGERPISKSRRPVRSKIHAVVIAASCDYKFLLRKRSGDGLLAGLWEFPEGEVTRRNTVTSVHNYLANGLGIDTAADQVELIPLSSVLHEFSHLKITYEPLLIFGTVQGPDCKLTDHEYRWVEYNSVKNLPLSVGQQKLLKHAKEALTPLNMRSGCGVGVFD